MVVIHNGIPPISDASTNRPGTRKELGLTDSDVLLLSVGRLVYQKGHEYLIEAMPRILARFPSVRVLICGDGPLRGELQSHIDRMHLQEPVKLLGNRNDIDRFLQSADIFVLPSRWEGLPVALLEAMGMGLPVVATQVEGVDEVLERDTDGLLVPPEDAMALGEALLRLIASAALRRNMGAAARGRIQESYTLDIMCEKYLVVMRSLVRGT
jgi:glycosyltransferase involved in cell wall biosynthesis